MGCQASKSAVADPGTAPPPAETKPEPEVKAEVKPDVKPEVKPEVKLDDKPDVKPDKSEKSDDGAGAFGSDVVQLEKITLVDADMPPIVEEEEEKEDAASPAAKASKDSEEVSTDPSTPDAEASPKVEESAAPAATSPPPKPLPKATATASSNTPKATSFGAPKARSSSFSNLLASISRAFSWSSKPEGDAIDPEVAAKLAAMQQATKEAAEAAALKPVSTSSAFAPQVMKSAPKSGPLDDDDGEIIDADEGTIQPVQSLTTTDNPYMKCMQNARASPLYAMGAAPLMSGPPVLEGPGPLDTHAAVSAACHNLEAIHDSLGQPSGIPEAAPFGGLAAARMGSLSNLGTPQPSYRNLADGLSGSYTPTPVYRRISQDATTMLTSSVKDLNTVVLASPLATPRLPERRPSYSPERRPLTRMSSDGTLPSVPPGAQTPRGTPRMITRQTVNPPVVRRASNDSTVFRRESGATQLGSSHVRTLSSGGHVRTLSGNGSVPSLAVASAPMRPHALSGSNFSATTTPTYTPRGITMGMAPLVTTGNLTPRY